MLVSPPLVVSSYVLEDGDEQVDQQDVGHQKVASHDGGDDPGAGLTGRQRHHHAVVCGDVHAARSYTRRQHKHRETAVSSDCPRSGGRVGSLNGIRKNDKY